MHEDERRDTELTRRMLLDEFISDPEKLQRVHLGLAERDRLARRRASETEQRLAELQAKVRRLEREATEAERERKSLTRRLADAHGALEAYRRETRRLKGDLERVRGSRSMRIGRALTSPASIFRSRPSARPAALAPADTEAAATTAAGADPAGAAPEMHARIAPTGPAATPLAESATVVAPQPWQLSFEQLQEQLDEQPTGSILNALLNRAWFQRGDIALCERLIEAHPDLVAKFPPKGRELIARIRGEARLRDGRITIPPRAHGAAYRVEAERVMYCVHSTPVFDSNGYSTRTRGLVDGLRENDVDVTVVSRLGYPWDMHPDAAPATRERSVVSMGDVEYTHLPGADLNRDPLDEYILRAADAYTREARIRRPAYIQAASNFRHALPALIAARRLGVPFVYEVRGLWELTEAVGKEGWEQSERFALQVRHETLVATEADQVLVITAQVRDELIARGVPAERIELAPNAVNEQEFVPLPVDRDYAKRMGIALDRPVIGFAGSLVAYEGLDVLLDALRIMRDRDVDVQVVIAGSGAAEDDLKAHSARLRLGDDVTFVGRVPATDIPRLMSTMDIMPCPRRSTTVTELVSPLKPLEALSSGKVVVLSDVAPQADLIPADSDRGFLVPAGDAEALAAQLERVLDDPDLARAAGRAGRLWITEHRTWTVLARAVRDAYRRAAQASSTALAAVPRIPLERIRIGIVADEFTTTTLASKVDVVAIPREEPASALAEDLDAIFIESAWEGNGGAWHRGVGYYDDEQFAALESLIAAARARGIPTIFWNKEDPVHVKRFLRAATSCDHVFTTDASLLGRYLREGRAHVLTASALPFYADLALHNPVQRPSALGATGVMYAGTYYGERYADRSKELTSLLRCAVPQGLTIYDRQFDDPASPYRFPAEFRNHVRGALPYREVLAAYKSHLANLNVNSVTDSPSMFSRRVVEIAASGGVVLSGPGRGVEETFGAAIPTSADAAFHRAHLARWAADPMSRLAEAWFQLRTVARSHTTDTALAVMLRTVGIPVDGLLDPGYVAVLPDGDAETVTAVLQQSAAPAALAVPTEDVEGVAARSTIPVVASAAALDAAAQLGLTAVIAFDRAPNRTLAEDLLIARRFRGDARVVARESSPAVDSRLLAIPQEDLAAVPGAGPRLAELRLLEPGDGTALELLLPPVPAARRPAAPSTRTSQPGARRTVLIAGHDLKFIDPYVDALRAQGHEVLIDRWTAHNEHDEEQSRSLLSRADAVWCEWGLGNAVWYSRHVSPEQTLVVRVHLQEIDLPFLKRIDSARVHSFIFVGELIRRAAIESHGIPAERSVVVPNFVQTEALRVPKDHDARFTLGLVGIVPQRKRLDLAVDLVERLRAVDDRYRLRIKGHRPEEYHWMADRPAEMAFYLEQYRRIEELNAAAGTEIVAFDPHGGDMAEWYARVGTVLSTSDFESFHLTLADGAASGSDAVSLAWAGADMIYPRSILFADIDAMERAVLDGAAREQRAHDLARAVRSMDAPRVFERFSSILLSEIAA